MVTTRRSPRRRRSTSAAPSSPLSSPGAPVTAPAPAPAPPVLLADTPSAKKWRGWRERFWTTWAMLGGFLVVVWGGHVPLTLLVFACQTVMFREIVSLGHVVAQEDKLPGFRHLQWFWWASAQWFCYSRTYYQIFPAGIDTFQWATRHNTFFSFMLYTIGVVGFVCSLKKGHYKYQFMMFAWCHLVIGVVVVQSSFLVHNLFTGAIWFLLPALLVVNNDVWAYFFGFFWGRTPLIKLSPKKTWEGFIGAFAMTIVVGFFLARVLAAFEFMTCPKESLSWQHPECGPQYVYTPAPYELPAAVSRALAAVGLPSWTYVTVSPVQWHGVAFAVFASVIAPFGGFFASGFKRAFKIKDFGTSIPGHGGVTDRMDCQIMMGLFTHVYVTTFVLSVSDASQVLWHFMRLPEDQQMDVFEQLRALVEAGGGGVGGVGA